jgi:hypothetical protein
MNWWQIITIGLSVLTLLGTITGLYIYVRVKLAEIEIRLNNFRHELDSEKIGYLQAEKFNREDHKEIIKKIDELIQRKC